MAYRVHAVAAAEFMVAFYERLFAGDTVSAAVAAGRRRLFEKNTRPSPKGDLPLADWLIPVHYLNREVSFPQARTERPASRPSLDASLDRLRDRHEEPAVGNLDPVGTFIGRDDLFYDLEEATRRERVAVLYGAGGTGKTELAKAFGRWWRDTGGVDRPDWVLWHSFEPGLASFGLAGVITEIGVAVFGSDFDGYDRDQQRSKVEAALAENRILLIWDNFEAVRSMPDPAGATKALDETGCQELLKFLEQVAKQGRSTVIITSRTPEQWLGPVRRLLVGGLAPQEAAQYAGQLLAPFPAASVRRARRAFGELLEWLDGHPLSMRLILPRLDAADPEALMEGLHGTVPLPGNDRIEGSRTTSLAVSITYSFAHLAAEARRLLPALCLFQGVADVGVLADFAQAPGVPERFRAVSQERWGEALDKAARVGLLTEAGAEARAGMYRIHPALPAYLAAQWRAEETGDHTAAWEAATRALLAASTRLAAWANQQIREGDTGLAFAILGLHRRTLGSLLGYALDHGLWAEANAITQPLNLYWNATGLHQEASGWADRAIDATEGADGTPPPLETPAGALWLFLSGAQAARLARSGRNDDAERVYLRNLAMLQSQSESPLRQRNMAVTCHQLGRISQNRGQLDAAENWYTQSLALMEELHDRFGVAANYHQFGVLAQLRGQLDAAETWYAKSLAIRKEIGDQPGMASSYHQLGMVARLSGRLNDAADSYQNSLAIREQYGDRPGMSLTYEQLGNMERDLGRLDRAENFYLTSLTIEEELGNQPGVAALYEQLGNVAKDRGQLADAENWYMRAAAIGEQLDDPPGIADIYYQLGGVAQDMERLDDAETWYRRALAIREECGDRPGMAAAYHQLGTVAHLRGLLDDAETWYAKSLTIEEGLSNPPGLAASYQQYGRLAQDRGLLDEAENWYLRSVSIQEKLADKPGLAANYGHLGLVAETRGQSHEALAWMIKCVALFEEIPHPATGPGPEHFARLARQLETGALERLWQQTTGAALPPAVRAYLGSSPTTGDG
jgi:tetratricopeptide (TPR) repeat protein